jgi:hypothetical protein
MTSRASAPVPASAPALVHLNTSPTVAELAVRSPLASQPAPEPTALMAYVFPNSSVVTVLFLAEMPSS